MIANTFNLLYEANFQKFQGGGILSGDVVKFIDNVEGHEWMKKQQPNFIEKLKQMMDSDQNIRVSSVKAVRPADGGARGDAAVAAPPAAARAGRHGRSD